MVAGAPSAYASVAIGAGVAGGVVMASNTFCIEIRDVQWNPCTERTNQRFLIQLFTRETAKRSKANEDEAVGDPEPPIEHVCGKEIEDFVANVEYKGGASYVVTYRVEQPGWYFLSVKMAATSDVKETGE